MKPTLNPKNPTLKRLAKIAQAKDMPSPTEDQIHRAFVEYVERKHPTLAQLLIHVPNEGKRSLAGGRRQKLLGLRAGVPDLFFARPRHIDYFYGNGNKLGHCDYHGLWIELKSRKGTVSKAQRNMMQELRNQEYWVVICYSLDEAINVFEYYIGTNETHTLNPNTEDIAPSEPER